jgi:hypothetical protein
MEADSMDARLKIVKILSFENDANLGGVDAEHPIGLGADGVPPPGVS